MPRFGPILLCAAFLAVSAFSDGGVKKAKRRDAEFSFKLTAGPGYVQRSFVETINGDLDENLGKRARKRLRRTRRLTAKEMVTLMNTRRAGEIKKLLRDGFGIRKADFGAGMRALRAAIEQKDRRVFFGVLARVLLARGLSSSGQFFEQVMAAQDEINTGQFKNLRHGSNRTRTLMEACFRFKDPKDQKDMLGFLDETRKSFLFGHPLAESIGIRPTDDYDPKRFPELKDGMPGTEKGFANGEAGGHRFDRKLPALPFRGDNVKELGRARRVPR